MPKDFYGKTLDEWRETDPDTWPERVRTAINNSDRFLAQPGKHSLRPPRPPISPPTGRRGPERDEDDDRELAKPRWDPEAASSLMAEEIEARQNRLTEIAYRYGDRDEKGVPFYGERTRASLHLLALLTLADKTLEGDVRAASDLARFTATNPELTVRHKIDLATDKDELLTMKAKVWLAMDAGAQKAYLMRLELEPRTALVERARQLETGEE